MLKKLFLIGVGAAGALAVTNAVWSGSVHTMWKKARTCVERQISPEFEIERIRGEISRLTPDMNRHIEKIAEATVDCAGLNRKIDLVQGELDKRQKDMLAMTERVEKGIVPVGYSPVSMKDKLSRDLRAYKTCEKDLENKQKLLAAKQKMLEAARNQLREIHAARGTLEVQLADMEAELANIRTVQTASKIQLDDSRLGEIKGSLDRLRGLVDGERIKTELTGQFLDPVGTEVNTEQPSKDVANEVREYLGATKTESAKKAE